MLTSAALETVDGLAHGFFTREGGVSDGIYASLNCGFGSGDRAEAVAENRRRAMAGLGLDPTALATVHQVHSADAVVVDAAWGGERPRADALATNRPGVCLGILSADCVPLLFADPEAGVIGAAHAGWKGVLGGVVEAVVHAMAGLGADPGRIRAAIGPAIRQASYEVGPEFRARFPGTASFFKPAPRWGRFHFDLPGYVRNRLDRLGLAAVDDLGLDTAGDEQRFFSYRRTTQRGEPDYGRMLSAIALVGSR